MEYLIIEFTHGIEDITPYCNFIKELEAKLSANKLGIYNGDDMAIDGGDAEAFFRVIALNFYLILLNMTYKNYHLCILKSR